MEAKSGDYFYFLIGCITIFKQIFKFIARKIDIINVIIYSKHNNSPTEPSIFNFISFEICIEFIMSLIYFVNYYYVFVMELSRINENRIYIQIITIHVCSEIIQSIIRFSRLYYQWTSRFYVKCIQFVNTHKTNDNENKCSNCIAKLLHIILVKLFQDDSTLDEWRIRHSIDMSIRVYSLTIASMYILAELLLGCNLLQPLRVFLNLDILLPNYYELLRLEDLIV